MSESFEVNEELIQYLDKLADDHPELVEKFQELAMAVSVLKGVREIALESMAHGAHPDAVIFSLTYAYLRMLQSRRDNIADQQLVDWLNNITDLHTRLLTLLSFHLADRALAQTDDLKELQQLHAQWKPAIAAALDQARNHTLDIKIEMAGGIGISLEATAIGLHEQGASFALLGTVFLNVLLQLMIFMGAPDPSLYFKMCQHWADIQEPLEQDLENYLLAA